MTRLELREMGMSFDNGVTALAGVSFAVEKGELMVMLGPSGAGKTTILRAIAGLIRPTRGDVLFDGNSVLEMPPEKRRVVMVFQKDTLFPFRTVAENLEYGLRMKKVQRAERRSRIGEALEAVQMHGAEHRWPDELSGGQRQRVFVAQGLAQDHDMLLLDEPLTGLDLISAQAIDSVIHDENAHGCTVVMSTHDLAEARAADHVVLLAGGVVASGAPEEVLTEANLAAAYGDMSVHRDGDGLVIDDPAHQPVDERHVHRERSIHTEAFPDDQHAGD